MYAVARMEPRKGAPEEMLMMAPCRHAAADVAAFYRVWAGRTSLAEAVRAGTVGLEGSPALVRAFPT